MNYKFPVTTYAFSCFGLTLCFDVVGADLLMIMFGMYWLLSLVDMGTRIYIERTVYGNPITSYKFSAGVVKRSIKSVIMLVLIGASGYINQLFVGSPANWGLLTIAYFPIFVMALFVLEELISVTENAIEVGDGRHNSVLKVLRYILGMGLETSLSIAKKRAEKFLEKEEHKKATVQVLKENGHNVTKKQKPKKK